MEMVNLSYTKMLEFAEACYDQNSVEELKDASEPDDFDMREWGITEHEWKTAINIARYAMENDVTIDEAEVVVK